MGLQQMTPCKWERGLVVSDLSFGKDVILHRQDGETLLCAAQGMQSISRLLYKHCAAVEIGAISPISGGEATGLLAAMTFLANNQADHLDRIAQRSQK